MRKARRTSGPLKKPGWLAARAVRSAVVDVGGSVRRPRLTALPSQRSLPARLVRVRLIREMRQTMEASPMMRRATVAFTAMVLTAGTAFAQSTVSTSLSTSTVSQTQQTTPPTQTDSMSQGMTMQPDRRPATTTVDGDTGLWFLPTAEVLGPRKWSFSLYR